MRNAIKYIMSIYLISDTHLNHEKIIDYCDRPFENLSDMESTIITNWNSVVDYGDTVLFGGDLAMADSSEAIRYSEKLNGNLVLLSGNHDEISKDEATFPVLESEYFTYEFDNKTYEFFYSHWPAGYSSKTDRNDSREQPKYSEPPDWFDGWNLHGHTHNNDLSNFPLINPENKTINVGSELLDYTPISIENIIKIIKLDQEYKTIRQVRDDLK